MDLIDKIKNVIQDSILHNSKVDLMYEGNSIVGDITSEYFRKRSDEESQKIIWDILTNNLQKDEITKITAIFHFTPEENASKFTKNDGFYAFDSNIWLYNSLDKSRYILFVDILKCSNGDYKTIYIVINSTYNFQKFRIYNYPKSVISWLLLETEDDIKFNLMGEVYECGKTEIEIDLMTKYDEQDNLGRRGKRNIYYNIFEEFSLKPIKNNRLLLNEDEIHILNNIYIKTKEFSINKIILDSITYSKIKNQPNI